MSEEFSVIDTCMDWLYAATRQSPRPHRTNAISEIEKEFLKGRDVCGSVQHYLRTLVPSRNLNLSAFLLYSAETIYDMSEDEDLGEYKHGFLIIGDYSNSGDASFVDLRNGFVYLFSIEVFVGWKRFEEIARDAANPDAILMEKSSRYFESFESFLLYCRQEAESALVRSMWESAMGEGGPSSHPDETDEMFARVLLNCLRTPFDALSLRNEKGQSLLDVAKERDKALQVRVLEEYWANPEKFMVRPGTC